MSVPSPPAPSPPQLPNPTPPGSELNRLDNAKGAKATDALLNYETVKLVGTRSFEFLIRVLPLGLALFASTHPLLARVLPLCITRGQPSCWACMPAPCPCGADRLSAPHVTVFCCCPCALPRLAGAPCPRPSVHANATAGCRRPSVQSGASRSTKPCPNICVLPLPLVPFASLAVQQ